MNDNNYNKPENKKDNGDNITKTKKKQPSKAAQVTKTIFFVNFKIFSYIINILLTILLIGIITGGIVAGTFAFYVMNDIDPVIDDLGVMSSESKLTTIIYYYEYEDRFNKTAPKGNDKEDPNWKKMDELHGEQNRTWVKFDQIPENLVNAFIAIEDKRFWTHNGVDWFRTADAARNFLVPTQKTFGGSTITQQLVKNMTKDDDTTIQRKLQEIRRAMYLESRTSKEDIMETYLNIVLLSNSCYGVQSAANTFFNKDVTELNLIECAAIAAIVQSPTAMNPIRRPERNKERRDEVIRLMLEQGLITQEEHDGAYDKELVINRPESSYIETVKSYYVDQIINDVTDALMEKYNYTREMASRQLFSGGLKVYACMDIEIQEIMESVYQYPEDDDNPNPYFPAQSRGAIKHQSAMVVLDPYSGDLLGIVGGRGDKVQRGWNRASMTTRQAGSAIKPISVYAPAIDAGIINWGTPMDDSPPIVLKNKLWPANLPPGYEGYITLSQALAVSKNTTAVRTLLELTPQVSFRFMYDELNMHNLVEKLIMSNGDMKTDIDVAPLSLGGLTNGVSVYELTAAYTILTNKGVYAKPRSYLMVEDSNGDIILDNRVPEKKIVISPETASIMTRLLMGVVENGTARGLHPDMKNSVQVAGKTGTTNEDYDRWFIGYTPYYLCGVWYGNDQNKFLGVGTGEKNPPLILFYSVMNALHKPIYDNPKEFEFSPNVVEAVYCRDSGMYPGPDCELDPRGSRRMMGYFVKGSEPTEPCNVHVKVAWDTSTGAVAGPGCPSENLKYISLVRNEKREFKGGNPYVTDAQYTYREVGPDYIYPNNTGVPFYNNLLPSGFYAGTSGVNRPINSFCIEHNRSMALPVENRPQPTTEPPPTTEPAAEMTTTAESTVITTTENPPTAETTTQPAIEETTPEITATTETPPAEPETPENINVTEETINEPENPE